MTEDRRQGILPFSLQEEAHLVQQLRPFHRGNFRRCELLRIPLEQQLVELDPRLLRAACQVKKLRKADVLVDGVTQLPLAHFCIGLSQGGDGPVEIAGTLLRRRPFVQFSGSVVMNAHERVLDGFCDRYQASWRPIPSPFKGNEQVKKPINGSQ
jgi:hypothetical protein